MPTRNSKTGTRTPAAPAPKAAPVKAAGLDQNTLLLAAFALQNGGQGVIDWASYGELMGRQGDVEAIHVRPTGEGMEVTLEWKGDEEDDTADVVAAQEVVKEAYRPAGTPASPAETAKVQGAAASTGLRPNPAPGAPAEKPKVGPAVDRPSFAHSTPDALANKGT